jgi:hypothetical protein
VKKKAKVGIGGKDKQRKIIGDDGWQNYHQKEKGFK